MGGTIVDDDGPAASSRCSTGADSSDLAMRLNGVGGVLFDLRTTQEANSCVKGSSFSSSYDACLSSPADCSLTTTGGIVGCTIVFAKIKKGFSFSVWVNLPHSFNTAPQYIIDTGY